VQLSPPHPPGVTHGVLGHFPAHFAQSSAPCRSATSHCTSSARATAATLWRVEAAWPVRSRRGHPCSRAASPPGPLRRLSVRRRASSPASSPASAASARQLPSSRVPALALGAAVMPASAASDCAAASVAAAARVATAAASAFGASEPDPAPSVVISLPEPQPPDEQSAAPLLGPVPGPRLPCAAPWRPAQRPSLRL